MNADDNDGAEVKLALGTMRGFREWELIRNQPGVMRSLTAASVFWETADQPSAKCLRPAMILNNWLALGKVGNLTHEGPAPERRCSCGYYALHQRFATLLFGAVIHPTFRVFGAVEGYGRMIVGPLGFRAERMKIVALAPSSLVISTPRIRDVTPMGQPVGLLLPGYPIYPSGTYRFTVEWTDGTMTHMMATVTHEEAATKPMADVLLAKARQVYPDKAKLDAWPLPKKELEERFKVPIFDSIDEMYQEFPAIPSPLIPTATVQAVTS